MRDPGSKGIHREMELEEQNGNILPDLTIGADVTGAEILEANLELCSRGVQLIGSGFKVTPEKARQLGLNEVEGLENHIRPYRNGRDLTQHSRDLMVIDLYGLEKEDGVPPIKWTVAGYHAATRGRRSEGSGCSRKYSFSQLTGDW